MHFVGHSLRWLDRNFARLFNWALFLGGLALWLYLYARTGT